MAATMYRITRSEASFDTGKIVYWLCERCFALLDEAVAVGSRCFTIPPPAQVAVATRGLIPRLDTPSPVG